MIFSGKMFVLNRKLSYICLIPMSDMDDMMEKIELTVQEVSKGLSYKDVYVLLLREVNGERRMPMMVGAEEAKMVVSKIRPNQIPLNGLPDLFCRLTNLYDIILEEVLIYKVDNGAFRAFLFLYRDGLTERIEGRASDAVVLALTYGRPIYISKNLFDRQYMREMGGGAVSLPINSLNVALLREALDNAIREENYELASQLRDELNRRK